jgi:hypothetical protein
MADYRGDFLSFEAVLDRAFLTASLPSLHDHVTIDPNAPSAIRVLAKSMHVLAIGWVASVAWLWIASLQQFVSRQGVAPENYALDTVISGLIPAAVIAWTGAAITRRAGHAPNKYLQRREWWQAFWWSAVPNALLFVTVWVMLQEAR